VRALVDSILYRGAPLRLRGRYRVVGGVRMYERSAPRRGAPVVVLVHGVGVSGRYFLPTAGRLAERCSVHAPDLPGFGRSAPHPRPLTTRRLADALEAWLDAAGLERPDAVVANSFGCQIALDLAARRPERVGRLVLAGPTVDRTARSLRRQAARLTLDILREPLALWALQAYDYAVHAWKSGLQGVTAMVEDAPEEKLARVTAPTLVVRGARDAIVPRRWAEELVAGLADGRLAEIPGAPHAVNYAAPDALARLTLELLAEKPAATEASAPALHSQP
jgi:2-hydroxy-6-oxonona-2,4-dienedioate hydrolase